MKMGINKNKWEYRPIMSYNKELMSIEGIRNSYGWWSLIYTNKNIRKCIDVKDNEIINNNWEKIIVIGYHNFNPININQKRKLKHNPNRPPYSVWGLNKPFTSQKVIKLEVDRNELDRKI